MATRKTIKRFEKGEAYIAVLSLPTPADAIFLICDTPGTATETAHLRAIVANNLNPNTPVKYHVHELIGEFEITPPSKHFIHTGLTMLEKMKVGILEPNPKHPVTKAVCWGEVWYSHTGRLERTVDWANNQEELTTCA